MRRGAAFLAFLLFLLQGQAEARRPRSPFRPLEVVPAPAVMDFGRVAPEESENAAAVEVYAGEEGPLEVRVFLPAEETACPLLQRGRLLLRVGDGPFTPVRPGLDLFLGKIRPPGGIVRLQGRLYVPWETPPGAFRLFLHLRLGSGADLPLTLRGEVAEVLLLQGVPARWRPTGDFDPSRRSSVAFGPQTVKVKANVPWRLEARLSAGSYAEKASDLFRRASLLFTGEGGKTEALTPGRPSLLFRGGPTSSAGVFVPLQPVLVFSGLPEEGTLELPLELRLVREGLP